MTRYYYTDPLAAAWMAKHFGMTITADTDELMAHYQHSQALGNEMHLMSDYLASETDGPWYIHPNSLHLLEPQVGDFVSFYDKYRFNGTQQKHGHLLRVDKGEYPWVYDDGGAAYASGSKPVRIIQRNGIAFHWPESGAA